MRREGVVQVQRKRLGERGEAREGAQHWGTLGIWIKAHRPASELVCFWGREGI